MASSLLTLVDDIATVLDDIAVMSKVAARKTVGVLGDDLALNAEQVSGVRAQRELPVVWAVAKGSFVNKLILVPAALLISAFIPWLITPLLMAGGLYLCFEGFEKVFQRFFPGAHHAEEHQQRIDAIADARVDMVAFEKRKIRGAIRTDFILSAEIIVISLGVVAHSPLTTQIAVVSLMALFMVVGVYGLVAVIVKIDDAGLAMIASDRRLQQAVGRGLLWVAPEMMKLLSVVGTAAMFLVGGGIIVHGIPVLTQWLNYLLAISPVINTFVINTLVEIIYNGVVGIIAGGLAVALFTAVSRVFKFGITNQARK